MLAGVAIAGFLQIGDDQETGPTEITATEQSTTVPADAAEESETPTTEPEPFSYRVGLLSGVTTDNFWAFYGEQPSAWNAYVLGPTKPALFTANPAEGSLQPELATSHVDPTFNKDGWRVRVDLNPDLRWSDGTPITAHDLVFTFETVRALSLGGSWAEAFPETIESIHADDDHRVHIEFTTRPRLSDWQHGVGSAPVMPKHVWEPEVEGVTAEDLYAMSGEADVSGGPLVLAAADDDLTVANRNPGYPLGEVPDTVEYRVFSDEGSAVAALKKGDVDSIVTPKGLAATSVDALAGEPGVEIVTNPGNAVRYLGFNLTRAPMSNSAFRTALALLLERDDLADQINGTGTPAWSLVPEANSQWYDTEAAGENAARYGGPLAKRLAKALEALRAAGYAWEEPPSIDAGELVAGKGLTIEGVPPQPLTILTPGDAYDPARPDYVREIAAVLGTLGFDARPVETDFDTVVDLAFTPGEDGRLHYDMYLLGWTLGNPVLPGYYEVLFAPDGAMNNTGYDSKRFSKALKRYDDAFTTEDARDALWQMERILAADLPYLPLYTSVITEAYRSDRVTFGTGTSLGGIQARLGGIGDVTPVD